MASSAAGPSASAGASGSGSSGFSNIPASGPGSSGFSGIPTSGSSTNNTNRHETATNQKKDSIIIGIDFGTTFSGAAWCYTGLGDRNKTKIVKSWPSNPKSLDKVSSIIQYSTKDTSKYKWGFEVNTDAQNPLKWFKLLLNQDSAGSNVTPVNSRPIPGSGDIRNQTGSLDSSIQGLNINDPAPIPETYTQNDSEQLAELFATLAALPQEKSPVDVVTDYLRAVYKHTRATIEKDYLPSFSSRIGTDIPLQFVLTVPAVWSDSAKALTLQAARAAGMDESYAKIQLVSEPEAAAIHCLKNYKETQDSLQVGDVYVIADCGGGTVDLISYEITEVEPRLRVKECAIGTGGLCGSTSLNRRFEALIKSRVGETEYANMSAIARGNTMRHFDDYLKPTFLPPEFSDISTGFEDEDDFDEVASYSCPLPGVAENPQKGIYKGHLILTADEMKSVFEPTFTRITKLVQEQVLAAEKKSEKNVTGILLVGGFGSSPYLYKHLSTEIKNKEGKEVKILQPVDAWTAIVRGAVSYGLSLSLGDSPDVADVPSVDSRIARFSYGVCAAERFIPGYHPSNRMVFNRWAGDFYCPGRMQWFVTVGDEIPENEPISVPFVRRCPTGAEKSDFIYTEEILCSEQPGRPPLNVDHDDIKHLLLFKADMSEVSRKKHFTRRRAAHGGDPYWEIRFNVLMKYHSASLEFWVEVGDKPVGKGTVEYMHEPPKGGAKEEYGL